MTRTEVAVVGAGIAGLACATELNEQGVDVLVFEAQSRVGGPVESVRKDGFLIERGPSTVRGTADLERIAERAGVSLEQGRRGAPYLVCDGELVRMPPSAGALLSGRPLPARALLGLLGEPFRGHPAGPRSVHEFVEQRAGRVAAERLADVLTLGVFGAPARRVGFESAFPNLAELLDAHGSLLRGFWARRREPREPRRGLVSTPGGLSALPRRIADKLGERVLLERPVRSVERREGGFELSIGGADDLKVRCRRLVLAVPPSQVAALVDLSPAAQRLTRGYCPSPQTLASFALEDPESVERWQGFGFLAPSRERLPLLGCLFPAAVFEGRAPAGAMLLTAFVGPALRNASEVAIATSLAPTLKRLLHSVREPVLLDVARHPEGICLYDRRHRDRTRLLRQRLREEGGPLLAGAAYDGVALGAAATSGVEAARLALS